MPQLRPEVLHHVVQTCGLEQCGDLLALTTSDQLRELSDLDLWRAARPGDEETLDAERFSLWLKVLAEMSPDMAARRLADLDPELVSAALAQLVRVYDIAAVSEYETTDGTRMAGRRFDADLSSEIGGFVVVARQDRAWGAIVDVLVALATCALTAACRRTRLTRTGSSA